MSNGSKFEFQVMNTFIIFVVFVVQMVILVSGPPKPKAYSGAEEGGDYGRGFYRWNPVWPE